MEVNHHETTTGEMYKARDKACEEIKSIITEFQLKHGVLIKKINLEHKTTGYNLPNIDTNIDVKIDAELL